MTPNDAKLDRKKRELKELLALPQPNTHLVNEKIAKHARAILEANERLEAQLAESELAHLDGNLQAAYDRGAAPRDLDPLWQRRSELLDALLSVRRQQVLSSRI